MLSWKDLYTVLTAVVPLYVAMLLAYASVRWWRIFSPEQCSGINRFVAVFAVPLLSFHFISTNNPYAMNLRFIAADTFQKLAAGAALAAWSFLPLRRRRSSGEPLDWAITIFSLSTLPNTLVMGIPLLIAMYGEFSGELMVQVVVLQCIVWYTVLLFLFEYRAARMLIADQFPGAAAAAIASFDVDADVASLAAGDIEADAAEIAGDGRIRVVVRKSTSSRRSAMMVTPRPSNLTGAEIYSLSSSTNPTPRCSNFNRSDFLVGGGGGGRPTPRTSNFDEHAVGAGAAGFAGAHYLPPPRHDAKELHMFVWSSTASPASDIAGGGHPVFGGSGGNIAAGAKEIRMLIPADIPANRIAKGKFNPPEPSLPDLKIPTFSKFLIWVFVLSAGINGGGEVGAAIPEAEGFIFGEEDDDNGGGGVPARGGTEELSKMGSTTSTAELHPKVGGGGGGEAPEGKQEMPPASVMTRLILIMVWRKLIRNPNTYSSLLGLAWSLVAFRWNVAMPRIVEKSISILSDAGLGMAMFSLGLFMALQPRIIACGGSVASFSMAVRFLAGPAVMAAASVIVGLRGTLLHVAIVQAALPQGIVPFVFAKEYNVHPTVLSTAVIFGMLIALPVTLLYYIFMGL